MNRKLKEVLSLSIYLLVVVCLAYLFVVFVAQRTQVIGESMMPTLQDNDNLLVEKISYRFHEPKRFDIIVFSVQKSDEKYFIKRIIGLPGETIYIDDDGTIYIKKKGEQEFTALKDYPGLDTIDEEKIGRAKHPITLADDEYFVLGDNRNNSTDSRSIMTVSRYNNQYLVGNVTKDRIIGRAVYKIRPFEEFGKIK